MRDEPVELLPPDIGAHAVGNTGIAYVSSFSSGEYGPHTVLTALMHGNELCGAIALDRFLRAGLRPRRGRLTFAFCNVAAFESFDPAYPSASRFVDEDMNRVWGPDLLAGGRSSQEVVRARDLWPVLGTADLLLDLHSMQHDTAPLILSGRSDQGCALARRVGYPGWIVRDSGHAAGLRLIDHPRFSSPDATAAAILVECGQHWRAPSAEVAVEAALRFLLATGTIDMADALALLPGSLAGRSPPRLVEITEAVTVANADFAFTRDYVGMEVVPEAGTLIALDGGREIRTPHDDCLLIMPSRWLSPGQTAVRLGRIVA